MRKGIETVDFYPAFFQELEMQDNPAFGENECLMIVADEHKHSVVLHIVPDPIESVNHIAKFWKHKDALEYCNYLENK